MTYVNQWPAGASKQKTGKQMKKCPRKKCGAVYSGDTHVCRDPQK